MSTVEENIDVIPVPEPNSDGMVTLLGDMFDQMLRQLPFTFSCGDVMGAALYVVIDAGLLGASSPEKLRQDILDGMDRILAERATAKGRLN